jgi:hypothetical protein
MRMFSKSRPEPHSISDYPVNDETIKTLINELSVQNNDASRRMVMLLVAVQDFRDRTAPRYQSQRNQYMQPKVSVKILNTLAGSLQDFKMATKDNAKDNAIYSYCIKAIKDRLASMSTSKDKIYEHYMNERNNLKELLTTEQASLTNKLR